jgi:hypothetical protein
MSSVDQSGPFVLGDLHVRRLGFGAMQLSGPNVFGEEALVASYAGAASEPGVDGVGLHLCQRCGSSLVVLVVSAAYRKYVRITSISSSPTSTRSAPRCRSMSA